MEEKGNILFMRSAKDEDSSMNEDDTWDDTALIEAYDHAVSLAKDEVMRRMGLDGQAPPPSTVAATTAESKKRTHHKKWNKTKSATKPVQWNIGDPCRCVYSEDGLSYEACIIQINPGGTCLVKYVGYNNEEEVNIKSLQFSHGHAGRIRQAEEARSGMFADSGNVEDDNDQEGTSSLQGSKVGSKSRQYRYREHSRYGSNNRLNDKSKPATGWDINPPNFSMSPLPMMFPPPPPPHVLASNESISDSEALSNMLMSWYMSGFHTGFYQGVMQNNQLRGSKCNCCHNKH